MSATNQYTKACDAAEAAIREGLRLAPNDAERGLWEAMLDRVSLVGVTHVASENRSP